jgi:shikimate dehydrogenase
VNVDVKGSTRLAGVIGWPLEHTLSPAMHNAAYRALGLDWLYIPLPVDDESDLSTVFAAIRVLPFVGANVTMPYKRATVALCDEVADLALLAGAVNTVLCADGRLVGFNTDGLGLLEALKADFSFDPVGRDVAVLGAGGAAGGAVAALAFAEARSVTVVNRDVERAQELAGRVAERYPAVTLSSVPFDESARTTVERADLVVNATSLGMKQEDPSPIPGSWLRGGQLVADMVYRAEPTALVVAAREAGATACDGLGMLVCQGAISADIWQGSGEVSTPRDVMRAAADRQLRRRTAS